MGFIPERLVVMMMMMMPIVIIIEGDPLPLAKSLITLYSRVVIKYIYYVMRPSHELTENGYHLQMPYE